MATPTLTSIAGVTPEVTTLTPTPPPDTRSSSPGLGQQQRYCLTWNNYQSNVTTTFKELLAVEDFVDITLMAEGGALRAHKVVLSACSPYFRDILKVYLEGAIVFIQNGQLEMYTERLFDIPRIKEVVERYLDDKGI